MIKDLKEIFSFGIKTQFISFLCLLLIFFIEIFMTGTFILHGWSIILLVSLKIISEITKIIFYKNKIPILQWYTKNNNNGGRIAALSFSLSHILTNIFIIMSLILYYFIKTTNPLVNVFSIIVWWILEFSIITICYYDKFVYDARNKVISEARKKLDKKE